MNRLILMRHGRAEGGSPGGDDHARPLAPQGRHDASRIADRLSARGVRPDRVLVSDARRTRQTWEAMADRFDAVDLTLSKTLYNADADVLARAVEAAEDEAECLILVAHNPGVHQLAVDLLRAGAAPASALDRLRAGFPPGAAVVFTVDVAGRCAFEAFFIPGDKSDS